MDADKIRQLFLLLLGATYIGVGIFILIKKVIPVSPWGEILSLVFILYGSFRVYRALKQN
jgi:F0F1-type ATP synthase assembly protein I